MKTVPYSEVQTLAADLAGWPRDKLAVSEAAMLRAFFAAELPDLWQREAWPELCDHIEQVTLDSNNCFSLREGAADEIGDLLALIVGGDPRLTTRVEVLPASQYTRLENRVNVMVLPPSGGLWLDWQTPCPDLLDDAVTGADPAAYELPARFKLPLAARGAALLVAEVDPQKADTLRALAAEKIQQEAQRLRKPWWR